MEYVKELKDRIYEILLKNNNAIVELDENKAECYIVEKGVFWD